MKYVIEFSAAEGHHRPPARLELSLSEMVPDPVGLLHPILLSLARQGYGSLRVQRVSELSWDLPTPFGMNDVRHAA